MCVSRLLSSWNFDLLLPCSQSVNGDALTLVAATASSQYVCKWSEEKKWELSCSLSRLSEKHNEANSCSTQHLLCVSKTSCNDDDGRGRSQKRKEIEAANNNATHCFGMHKLGCGNVLPLYPSIHSSTIHWIGSFARSFTEQQLLRDANYSPICCWYPCRRYTEMFRFLLIFHRSGGHLFSGA